MATVEKELQDLNKTVNEAVNILRLYVGNSAQVKNMNEKQREAINKWFDITVEAEEQQKKQRAFTERARDEHGRFISKVEKSNSNFLNMAKSVGGMFMGMTKAVKTSISSLASGITQHMQSFFQAVKSQFLSLFGEESEWFDLLASIRDSVTGFVGWFAKGFMMIFRRTPVWAGKMVSVLKDIYKLQVKQMKMDFLGAGGDTKKKGVSMMGIIGALVFAIGAAIGSFLHRYFVLITKLPIFQRVAQWFTKLDDIPFIGKLFKAIKFGFKWLGWPLTIILSVIDFMRGFAETEGTLWEKIKGGWWKALEGFIELPVLFIGWVIEKVLGWFGVEVEGVGQKMMDIIKTGFHMILDGYAMLFGLIKDGVVALFKGEWVTKLAEAITPIVAGVYNFFVDFWNSMVEWITSKIPSWLPGKDKVIAGLTSMEMSRMEVPTETTSPVDAMSDLEKRKIAEQQTKDDETKKALEKLDKSVKEQGQKTSDSINAAAINQTAQGAGGAGAETQQIPDEIENMGVMFNNVLMGS